MKDELENLTGPMLDETKRVQQKALEQYYAHRNGRKKFKWGYPVVIVLFLCMVVFIFPLQKPEETTSNLYIEPIDEQFFLLAVYSDQYNQGQFMTKSDAIEHNLFFAIERSALLTYAKYENIKIDKESVLKNAKQSFSYIEGNPLSKLKHEKMLQALGLSNDEYKDILIKNATVNSVIESFIKERGLKGPKGKYIGQIHKEAREFYYKHAAREIEKFETEQRSKVTEKPPLIEVQTPDTFRFAEKEHLALDLGLNDQQQYEFINVNMTFDYIRETYGSLIYEAAPIKEYPFHFEPLFYMDYKRNIEQMILQPKWREEALEVLELLEIFERSYIDDYPFLQ
ncbi:hypothetical protein [Solibacillus isronensis]|uniref:hypothetical protein n=1 Tax=Solibacillus isronensis TaxID=412383 RepID=UPI00203B75D4|nr:hypothetical protein [Solibacillus isronensis]MCM3721649.1 hypothetical protein [Solibacillus isronensis]